MTTSPETRQPRSVTPQYIYVGTSGWAYTSWKPGFYPKSVSAKVFLAYYSTRLNSVEVNYTFRALPTQAMLEGWLAATQPDFRFSFKAPQRITHMLRLRNCGEVLAAFLQSLTPAVRAQKMGLILFQLPPNMKADFELLNQFLDESRTRLAGHRLAFEFRHPSWFSQPTYTVLQGHNAALCIAESDELTTPDTQTATYASYRLRLSAYSTRQLEALAEKFAATSAETFVYFKHEDEPDGPLRAEALRKRLAEIRS